MRLAVLAVLLFVTVSGIALPRECNLRPEPPIPVPVEQNYTVIPIPPGMYLCREMEDGKFNCLGVPPGAALLLPIPEEAPVDTLRRF